VTGDIVANLTLSPSVGVTDGEQFCTYSPSAMHELIDVQGFFAPASGGGFGYVTPGNGPSRVLDTRLCWTDALSDVERCGEVINGGEIIHLNAPAGAKTVVVNITTLGASFNGSFVSAGRCSDITAAVPTFSNVNAVVGTSVANAAIVQVDTDGTYCAYVSHPMHVIIDMMGTFASSGGLRFLATPPTRVHDSRTPG
jgi:hypothetical protein